MEGVLPVDEEYVEFEKSEEWRRCLYKPMVDAESSYVAYLITLCKSHMKPGQVSWRNVYAAYLATVRGMGLWLQGGARSCSGLWSKECFLKLDIREFFMSSSLLNELKGVVWGTPEEKKLTLEVADWLLNQQFLLSSETPGLHQLIRGSGMGFDFSPELADATYANRADKLLMQARVHRRFRVKIWWRFKDDVLVVLMSNCQHELLSLIQNRAAPAFVIAIVEDQCNSVSVDSLSLSVRVEVGKSGKVSTTPNLRPPTMPRSVSNAHPVDVHSRWPTGYARSLLRLRSNDCMKGDSYKESYSRFERAYVFPARLRLLQRPLESVRDQRGGVSVRP